MTCEPLLTERTRVVMGQLGAELGAELVLVGWGGKGGGRSCRSNDKEAGGELGVLSFDGGLQAGLRAEGKAEAAGHPLLNQQQSLRGCQTPALSLRAENRPHKLKKRARNQET